MKLNNIRKEIDEIDQQLASLLNKRFLLVDQVKNIKKTETIEIENKDREKEVINKNIVFIDKNFHNQYINIYEAIFKASKDYQKQ